MTLTSDTIDLRIENDLLDHAYAWGTTSTARRSCRRAQNMIADSLDVTMPGQHVQLVRALRHAFAQGRPDTTRYKISTDPTRPIGSSATRSSRTSTASARSPRDTSKIAAASSSSSPAATPARSITSRRATATSTARRSTTSRRATSPSISTTRTKVATVTTVDSVTGIFIEPRPTRRRSDGSVGDAIESRSTQNGLRPRRLPKPVPKPPSPGYSMSRRFDRPTSDRP